MGGTTTAIEQMVASVTSITDMALAAISGTAATVEVKNSRVAAAEKYQNLAAARRAEIRAEKDALAKLTKDHKLSFQHVLPNPALGVRGMTVCYAVHKKNVVRFSIALCGPKDQFTKSLGSAAAAKKFAKGNWTEIHVPHDIGRALNSFMNQWINAITTITPEVFVKKEEVSKTESSSPEVTSDAPTINRFICLPLNY